MKKSFAEKILDSMVDENDVWICVKPGEKIKLCGTVKQHDIYNGVMQTVLNRCKVVEVGH